MKSFKYILALAAILTLTAAGSLAGLKDTPPQDGATVTAEMKACEKDSDCVLVDTECSGCCGYESVAQQSLEQFTKEKKFVKAGMAPYATATTLSANPSV